jgi:hypothetical protein
MKKFPYIGYSEKELKYLEENFYFIQLGGDFIAVDGTHSFPQKEAGKLYWDALDDLVKMAKEGLDEKEVAYALNLIGSLRIQPVRVH